MEREETKKIVGIMMASYPNYHPVDIKMTVDTWTLMFKDYTYDKVAMALQTYIMSNPSGFAPSIGQLVETMQKVDMPNELSEAEAWEKVSRALRNSTYHAEEEFEKLPSVIQKVVGSPTQLRNWGQTDIESIENVVQSNFMRSYRSVVKRQKEILRMPTEVRNLIEQTTNNLNLIEEK